MRFPDSALRLQAMGCALFALVCSPASAQTALDPVLDIFDRLVFNGRTLKEHKVRADRATFANSEIAKVYDATDPKRSILISDCTTFDCSQDYLRFQSVFGVAARAADPQRPDGERLYKSWYDTVSQPGMDDGFSSMVPYQPLAKPTYQLLAVANRMDMGSWDGEEWSGAEIHFVYGKLPSEDDYINSVTVILEFELAPDGWRGFSRSEFQKLGKQWLLLSRADRSAYPAALKATLRASGLPFSAGDKCGIRAVRVRVNRKTNEAQWQFTQLQLDPLTAGKFSPARLNDQIRQDITPAALIRLWRRATDAIQKGAVSYQIPGHLLERPSVIYSNGNYGMSTPKGLCNADTKTRDMLGIQQCTQCHTSESATGFTHIANRHLEESAPLSGFLAGSAGNLHPSLVDLYNTNPAVVWTVTVHYMTYSGNRGCGTEEEAPIPATNKFHDVARRTLFLTAVVVDQLGRLPAPPAEFLSTHSVE